MRSSTLPKAAVTKAGRAESDPSGESETPRDRAQQNGQRVAKNTARVPTKQIVRWYFDDKLTASQIARLAGCSRQAVEKRLKRFAPVLDHPDDEAYCDMRVRLLRGVQLRTLSEMSKPDRLKKASLRDLTIQFGTTYDKERLETGQSTANVALHALVESIERERAPQPIVGEAPSL